MGDRSRYHDLHGGDSSPHNATALNRYNNSDPAVYPFHIRSPAPGFASADHEEDPTIMQPYPDPPKHLPLDSIHTALPHRQPKRHRNDSAGHQQNHPRTFRPPKVQRTRLATPQHQQNPQQQYQQQRSSPSSDPKVGTTPGPLKSPSSNVSPQYHSQQHPALAPVPGTKTALQNRGRHSRDPKAPTSKPLSSSQLPFGPNRTTQNVIESHQINATRHKTPLPARGPPDDGDDDDEIIDDDEEEELPDPSPHVMSQPESRPISQQQLAAEVKGIYSNLVMLETKCTEAITNVTTRARAYDQDALERSGKGLKPSSSPHPLSKEQLRPLADLHRTLLFEHHDFLLASHHPSASPVIKSLAAKYSIPARMWKHGIHTFLELLRYRLRDSLDLMLAFLILAYQMVALLYDTIPAFEETWIECLGDLARYRMAIEDEDPRDRETWTGVARMWYLRAVDIDPNVGRLYHHLAILSRQHPVQQLSSYCRALTANVPFLATRESVLTLFTPTLSRWRTDPKRSCPNDTAFVITHAIIYTRGTVEEVCRAMRQFKGQLNEQIGGVGARWRETGAFMATTNIGSILKYPNTSSAIRSILSEGKPASDQKQDAPQPESNEDWPDADLTPTDTPAFTAPYEWRLAIETLAVCLRRTTDLNVLPHIHIMLVFFWRLSLTPEGAAYVVMYTPWQLLAAYLNQLMHIIHVDRVPRTFPLPDAKDEQVPLWEDYLIHGQVWSNGYFPEGWFARASNDLDERHMERAGTMAVRGDRVLWIADRLARTLKKVVGGGGSDAQKDDDGNDGNGRWMRFEPDPTPDGSSFVAGPGGSAAFMDVRHARAQHGAFHPMRSAEADRGGSERGERGDRSEPSKPSEHGEFSRHGEQREHREQLKRREQNRQGKQRERIQPRPQSRQSQNAQTTYASEEMAGVEAT